MRTTKTSGLTFEEGTQECGLCKKKKGIIQFERKSTRKNLPIIEIAFFCNDCAINNNLIKDSIEVYK